jgi:hypothetical protein
VDALNLVRNLIVHKDGKVDQEYVNRSKNLKVPSGKLGTRIPLNGDIVVSLIKPAIDAANQLLEAVDQWMVKHP